jgi:5'(3')-deoxyribonucleotidase
MICYLDLDGVLADFVGGVCNAFNIPRHKLLDRLPKGQFDLAPALGISESDFWGIVDNHLYFWRSLQITPDGMEILKLCEDHFDEVVIMTSAPYNPQAAADKVWWINSFLPNYKRKYAITSCKSAFAHPEAVLVDDSDNNIEKFGHAGGGTILVPRHWNSFWKHDHMVLDFLKESLIQDVGLKG